MRAVFVCFLPATKTQRSNVHIRLSLFEIFLLEVLAWFALWLLDDYLATLLTLILGAIVSAILVIALLSERIEPTKVPRRYFQVMALSVLALLVAAGLYAFIFDAEFEFLQKI